LGHLSHLGQGSFSCPNERLSMQGMLLIQTDEIAGPSSSPYYLRFIIPLLPAPQAGWRAPGQGGAARKGRPYQRPTNHLLQV
jgi:hypothetical protein